MQSKLILTARLNQRIDQIDHQKYFYDAFIVCPNYTSYFCGQIVIKLQYDSDNIPNFSYRSSLVTPADLSETEVKELIDQLVKELIW